MERVYSFLTDKDMKLPIFVTGVGFEKYQDHVNRNAGYHHYHLAFCEDGAGKLLIDNKEFIINKGKAFFFHPNVPHEYYPFKEPWSLRWITFFGYGVDAILDFMDFNSYEIFKYINPEEVTLCYSKLFRALSAKKATSMLEASGIFYAFLSSIHSIIEPENAENKSQVMEKLNIVTEEIKANIQKDWSLDELAAIAGISPSYLCRIFKKIYCMSPFSYIIQYRIHQAKEMLIRYPDKSIKNIAIDSGFHNCSYFGSIFKEHEGCSPTHFRKLLSY